MMDISTPYYEDLTRISNSNIGWFLQKGPAFLHKMLTDPPVEEKNPVLERGTMIHEYILQPEEFQKHYVVWDKGRPTTALQEKFCKELVNSVEIEPKKALISAYKATYKTGRLNDQTIEEKAVELKNELSDYIEALKAGDTRIPIGHYDYQMLETIKENIRKHKMATRLLDSSKHEFHINWEFTTFPEEGGVYNIKCKSLLDSFRVDAKNKVCRIADLKTTQNIWTFEDSIIKYDYLRQLAYYEMAARWYIKNELKDDAEQYTFKFFIIAIDTTGTYNIRMFEITREQIEKYDQYYKIADALHKIAWHQYNNIWDCSRQAYLSNGIETLNL